MASLDDLLQVHSLAASSALRYLRALRERLRFQPLLRLVGRSLAAEPDKPLLRVPLMCKSFDDARSQAEFEARERDRRAGRIRGDEDDQQILYRRRPGRDRGRAKEGDEDDDRETPRREPPRPLEETVAKLRRAWIVADPGGGKTEFLKAAVLAAVEPTIAALEDHPTLVDEIRLPVWISLPRLGAVLREHAQRAAALSGRSGAPDSVAAFAGDAFGFTPDATDDYRRSAALVLCAAQSESLKDRRSTLGGWALRRLWRDWTGTGGSTSTEQLVVFDAWDEVADDARPLVYDRLRAFLAGFPGRTFVSARIVGFNPALVSPQARRAGAAADEAIVEIQPFTAAETERFLRTFFHEEEALGERLIADLRAKPALHGMAENPLLVTLLAIAFTPGGKPLALPARRGDVYDAVLDRLLGPDVQGTHKGGNFELSAAERKALRRVLGEIALRFFPDEGLDAGAVSALLASFEAERELSTLGQRWLRNLHPDEKPPDRPVWLADFLQHQAGLLVPLGDGRTVRFLHLTFQEFLAAETMARAVDGPDPGTGRAAGWKRACVTVRERQDDESPARTLRVRVQALADRKAIHPAWHEVLILFAGRLDDPLPLLNLLADDRRDFATHDRLALAGQCLGDVTEKAWPRVARLGALLEQRLLRVWWRHTNRRWQALIARVTRALRVVIQCREMADDGSASATFFWFAARPWRTKYVDDLIDCFSAKRTVALLSRWLADSHEHEIQSAMEIVVEVFKGFPGEKSREVRRHAIRGVKALAAHALWTELLPLLRQGLADSDKWVREGAIQGVGVLAAHAPWAELLPLLRQGLTESDDHMHKAAINGVGALAAHAPWAELLPVLRQWIANSAGPTPSNWDDHMQEAAICGVGAMAAHVPWAELLPLLRQGLDNSGGWRNWRSRDAAMRGVAALAAHAPSVELLPLLRQGLADSVSYVRNRASKVLEALPAHAPCADLLPLLHHRFADSDRAVREDAIRGVGALAGHVPCAEMLPLLRQGLADSDRDVRCSTIWSVVSLAAHAPWTELLPLLRQGLADSELWVRRAAIRGVGMLAAHAPWTELLPLLRQGLADVSHPHWEYPNCEYAIDGVEMLAAHAPWSELLPLLRQWLAKSAWRGFWKRGLRDDTFLYHCAAMRCVAALAARAPWAELLPLLRRGLASPCADAQRSAMRGVETLVAHTPRAELLLLLRQGLSPWRDARRSAMRGVGTLAAHTPRADVRPLVRRWIAHSYRFEIMIPDDPEEVARALAKTHSVGWRWRVPTFFCRLIGIPVEAFLVQEIVKLQPEDIATEL